MLVIAAATAHELKSLLQRASARHCPGPAGLTLYACRIGGHDCLVARTGVGLKQAAAAARRIIAGCGPGAMLSIGAAGALDPGLNAGDIVVVDAVLHPAGTRLPTDAAQSGSIRERLAAAGIPCRSGSCLSKATFVHRAEEKQALFRQTGALVLDMESAALAAGCAAAGIAMLDVRIVSDSAREDAFDVAGYYGFRKSAGGARPRDFFARHPRELARAVLLKKNIALVSRRVPDILEAVLPL